MKLYHFCANHLLQSILKDGLTLGVMPYVKNGRIKIVSGYQWLTLNDSFDQEWEKYPSLPYRRNANRITVKIPKTDVNLLKWSRFSKVDEFKETGEELNSYGDPENWFIYVGKVKVKYLREVVKNPNS